MNRSRCGDMGGGQHHGAAAKTVMSRFGSNKWMRKLWWRRAADLFKHRDTETERTEPVECCALDMALRPERAKRAR